MEGEMRKMAADVKKNAFMYIKQAKSTLYRQLQENF